MTLRTTPENAAAAEEWPEQNLLDLEIAVGITRAADVLGKDVADAGLRTVRSLIGALRHARAERDALRGDGDDGTATNDATEWCPMTIWVRVIGDIAAGAALQLTISGDQGDWHANAVIHRRAGSVAHHIGDGFARFGDAQAAAEDFATRWAAGERAATGKS